MTFIIKVTVSATLATLIAAITFSKGSWTPWRQGGLEQPYSKKKEGAVLSDKGSNQGFYTATRDKGLLVSDTAADNMRAAA